MLTEHFVASIGTPTKAPTTSATKDAGIFIHEFQPLAAQRALFKKSATGANCLAVSESHIFAAQSEKPVVHVYNREKGNQEATVPFTERITCIALACDDTVLVLGTAEGRIFLWEICTGRQVTSNQSHLQAVTCLAVHPTSNFLLSASSDTTVHIWSLPLLLSFVSSNSSIDVLAPLQTFTSHRTEITALVLGHSASIGNIAVSASKDKTCLVWNYYTCNVLRTYILPRTPLCLALDPVDRAVYVGYDDGSLQSLDLYSTSSRADTITSDLYENTESNEVGPIQPSPSSHWMPPEATFSSALSISVSYDGYTVLSGHESGAIVAWEVAKGLFVSKVTQNPLPGPVTSLCFLPVMGCAGSQERKLKVQSIVKPRFGAYDSGGNGEVPGNYTFTTQFRSSLERGESISFAQALIHASYPQPLLEASLQELASWGSASQSGSANGSAEDVEQEDFVAFDNAPRKPRKLTLEEQNKRLRAQLDALRRVQVASFERMEKIDTERKVLLQREERRIIKKAGKVNGDGGIDGDADTREGEDEDGEMNDDIESDVEDDESAQD